MKAVISVADKQGIETMALELVQLGIEVFSHGETLQTIGGAATGGHSSKMLAMGDRSLSNTPASRERLMALLALQALPTATSTGTFGAQVIDLIIVDFKSGHDFGGPVLARAGLLGDRIVVAHPDQRLLALTYLRASPEERPKLLKQLNEAAQAVLSTSF